MASTIQIPDNFRAIILDFTNDLSITFPECADSWSKWNDPNVSSVDLHELFNYCVNIFPARFFDIIYQNQDLFGPESTINVEFLPGIDFKMLFNCNEVSEQTKKSLWKYLQLILITVVGDMKDKQSFGDTLNLFDNIDETELHQKLSETVTGITEFFDKSIDDGGNSSKTDQSTPNPFSKMDGLPDIQDHLHSLLNGKIGALAKEMADDIADDFKDVLGDGIGMENPQDIIKKLMQNPQKISNLLKTVGTKLDTKMKNGDISRDELMKEAGEMMNKMKDLGGQDQFNDLFKNISKNMGGMAGMAGMAGMGGMGGMGGMEGLVGMLGKNMKMDTNAIDRMSKADSTKDRLRKVIEQRKQSEQITNSSNNGQIVNAIDYIHPDLIAEMDNEQSKNQSKNQNQSQKKKKKKGK